MFDLYSSSSQALEFRNEDQACLVARSKCYLQLGSTKAALEDAESSLKDDAKYHRVNDIHALAYTYDDGIYIPLLGIVSKS